VSNVRVNAGGPAVGVFAADSGFSTSNIQGTGATVTTAGVTNAAPASLYDTERWNSGSLTYTSPVLTPGRTYTVRLHFAERYVGAANQRRFNIGINGATSGPNYVANFDVFVAAGNAMNKAVVRDFSDITPDATGCITVTLSLGSIQLPMLNGLEILAQPIGWELWQGSNFSPSQLLDPSISGPDAAPAGDGVANLLKYAFNMLGNGPGQMATVGSPNAAVLTANGSAGLPLLGVESASDKLQLSYIRRRASSNPGITYTVEFSDALTSWRINASATESTTAIDPTFDRVTVTDSINPARRFVRVRITMP